MIEEKEENVLESGAELARGYTKVHLSPGRLMFNNFLGGLAWGFGTILGGTIVALIVLFILSKLNTVPILGEFISRILEQIQIRQPLQ